MIAMVSWPLTTDLITASWPGRNSSRPNVPRMRCCSGFMAAARRGILQEEQGVYPGSDVPRATCDGPRATGDVARATAISESRGPAHGATSPGLQTTGCGLLPGRGLFTGALSLVGQLVRVDQHLRGHAGD